MSTDVTPSEQSELSAYVIEEILGLMGRRRISKAGMARTLGVSEVWVGRRLNGRLPLALNDLQHIAAVLGVSAVDLFPKGDTRRYPHTSDPLAPRLVATVGDPTRRPRPPRVGRGQRAVRLPRPGIVASRRSVNRPVTPAVR